MSQKWSAAETYLIELGCQFYDGFNFYSIEDEQANKANNPSFESVMEGMDESSMIVILSAIAFINS